MMTLTMTITTIMTVGSRNSSTSSTSSSSVLCTICYVQYLGTALPGPAVHRGRRGGRRAGDDSVGVAPGVPPPTRWVSRRGRRGGRRAGDDAVDLRSRRYLENFHQHPWKFGFVFLPFFFSAAAAKKVAVFFSSDQNSAVAQALTKAFSELC